MTTSPILFRRQFKRTGSLFTAICGRTLCLLIQLSVFSYSTYSCVNQLEWAFWVHIAAVHQKVSMVTLTHHVCRDVSHFLLLFSVFLCHLLIQKLFTNYSQTTQPEDTNRLLLNNTARTETTHGPAYSMAKAIVATTWLKGFIC